MTNLVALDVPGGPAFVEALERIWQRGDAAWPVDPRLPDAERARVTAALAPSSVLRLDHDGSLDETPLEGGVPLLDGDALVIPTSGTTGLPKGVIHTHDSVRASALATSTALDVDPARDRWLACLPLAHVGGLSVVTRSLVTGTPLEVHDRFDPAAVVASLERGTTLVSLVTRALAQVPVDAFRRVVIGGAAPPPDRPANVIATYGMTETGSGVVYERRPIDGVSLRIATPDPAGHGELEVAGPMLLRAYRTLDDPAGRDPKVDGWFATGDLGTIDAEGVLQVFGRAGDVIVSGGEKVWPARVEPLLDRHSKVGRAMIVGRPHPEWGHEVVARVEPADPADPPTLDELRDWVKADLPAWYAPRSLELVDALPTTSLGKLRRG
ncbi:MAG: class I adenylate-forming enzyme family protein [Acidimicrobiales bacterium]